MYPCNATFINYSCNHVFWLITTSKLTLLENLQSKSMDWFLYDRDLRHERVKAVPLQIAICANIASVTNACENCDTFYKNLAF